MKRALFFLPLVVLFSCSSTSSDKFKHQPQDTFLTAALYFDNAKMGRLDSALRISVDSLRVDKSDSNSLTPKMVWYRDTTYYGCLWDSLRNREGKPVFDTITKRWQLRRYFYLLPKHQLMEDYNRGRRWSVLYPF